MAGDTVGELATIVDSYRREEDMLPSHIDDRLRPTAIASREADGSVARLRAEFEAAYRDDARRVDLAGRLTGAEALAARLRRRAEQLEEIAAVREEALVAIAGLHGKAHAAGDELRGGGSIRGRSGASSRTGRPNRRGPRSLRPHLGRRARSTPMLPGGPTSSKS